MTKDPEHFQKCEALAHQIGIAALVACIPATRTEIAEVLLSGDESLNRIARHQWEMAAAIVLYELGPKAGLRALSIAEGVSVLKHVTRRHYLQHPPVGRRRVPSATLYDKLLDQLGGTKAFAAELLSHARRRANREGRVQ